MRIALDAHTLCSGAGGNERYVAGLLEGMATIAPDELVVYVSPGAMDELPAGIRSSSFVLRSRGPIARLAWELPRRLERDQVDVAHFQYIGPLHCPCPMVVAVHDPSFRLSPGLVGWRLAARMRLTTGTVLRRAAAVLAPSAWAAARLQALYPGSAARVHVVPLGVSERFEPRSPPDDGTVRAALGLPERYLLFVGRRQRRKNVVHLVGAYRDARERDPELPPLVLAGPRSAEDRRLAVLLERAGLTRSVLVLSDVPEASLPAVYRGATLFCFPARLEGFGLPVLEAMACGCPVVAADEGGLPELLGDVGLLLPPFDAEPWATALVRLSRDSEKRRELGRRAAERAREYSWSRTAQATYDHYVRLAG